MELTESGIKAVGDIPWGTHFCQFYKTDADLMEVLVPYFRAGLENKEYCLYLASEPPAAEEAARYLKSRLPGLDRHLARRDLEIDSMKSFFSGGNDFDSKKVVKVWSEKLSEARGRGLVGMRVGGDQSWQIPDNWSALSKIERGLNRSLINQRMIIMCSYPIQKCAADAILDVARSHEFVIAVREGDWEMIESPQLRIAKTELKKLNKELEKKVLESQHYIESLTRDEGLRRQFLSWLTHDIRNPLGAALNSAQLLARRLPTNPHVKTLTNRVVFALQRADALIQDLLDLNKILSNMPIPFDLEEIDLYDILENKVKRLERASGVRFVLSSPRGIIGCWDRRTLSVAMDSLITSSSIYVDAGAPVFIDVDVGAFISITMHFKGKAPWIVDRDRWLLLSTLAKGIIHQHGGKLQADIMLTQEIRYHLELPRNAERAAA
jgi:signal transduction histidine kinase